MLWAAWTWWALEDTAWGRAGPSGGINIHSHLGFCSDQELFFFFFFKSVAGQHRLYFFKLLGLKSGFIFPLVSQPGQQQVLIYYNSCLFVLLGSWLEGKCALIHQRTAMRVEEDWREVIWVSGACLSHMRGLLLLTKFTANVQWKHIKKCFHQSVVIRTLAVRSLTSLGCTSWLLMNARIQNNKAAVV